MDHSLALAINLVHDDLLAWSQDKTALEQFPTVLEQLISEKKVKLVHKPDGDFDLLVDGVVVPPETNNRAFAIDFLGYDDPTKTDQEMMEQLVRDKGGEPVEIEIEVIEEHPAGRK
jgi:hypothetical protein